MLRPLIEDPPLLREVPDPVADVFVSLSLLHAAPASATTTSGASTHAVRRVKSCKRALLGRCPSCRGHAKKSRLPHRCAKVNARRTAAEHLATDAVEPTARTRRASSAASRCGCARTPGRDASVVVSASQVVA